MYLPTRIRRVVVDSAKHLTILAKSNRNGSTVQHLTASYDPQLKLIECGGVEIYDMNVNAISRRKPGGIEVLESYRFLPLVPSETLTLNSGVHVILQLILENLCSVSRLKIVEINAKCVSPLIVVFDQAVSRTPLVNVKCDLQLFTDEEIALENITILKNLTSNAISKGNILTIVMDSTSNETDEILHSIEENSFLLVRKIGNTTFTEVPQNFNMITAIPTESETLVLLQRKQATSIATTAVATKQPTVIEVLSTDFNIQWLEKVKESIKAGPVLLVAQSDPSPGLLGLMNCLRREPGAENVRCVLIMDRLTPKFSLNDNLYASQLQLGLAVNIYRNSVWGTYRFFPLIPHLPETARLDHCFANVQRIGDLSSFNWFNGCLKPTADKLVNVHYSSINFRDVMLASGRLSMEFYRSARTDDDCMLGLEFSGVNSAGERVMGMVKSGAMATQVQQIEHLTWLIPKDWSLRDGATIPAVYITVYYAFFFGKSIQRGNSILIHAGSGGIGLAGTFSS